MIQLYLKQIQTSRTTVTTFLVDRHSRNIITMVYLTILVDDIVTDQFSRF